MKLLITGGAGYIGSQVAHLCQEQGHEVFVYDNLSTGFREAVSKQMRFILGDVRDGQLLGRVLRDQKIDAVIHFAAKLLVGESMTKPVEYYENNVGGMIQLLKACEAENVNKIVFSSTAAVYGETSSEPVMESAPLAPINPYGQSKVMCEQLLRDYAQANTEFRFVVLRYFNVAGATPAGGQRTLNATHLIKVAAEVAAGKRKDLSIFGTDYQTSDGTCVRDYIHIGDLAQAHLSALDYMVRENKSGIYNCGYGHGSSVLEVIQAMQKVSGVNFEVVKGPRRAGDPARVVADSSRARADLKWIPQFDNLEEICRSAFDWEKRN